LRFIFALRIFEALFSKKNKKSGQNEFGERIIDIGAHVFFGAIPGTSPYRIQLSAIDGVIWALLKIQDSLCDG